jgi:hypothetical protein
VRSRSASYTSAASRAMMRTAIAAIKREYKR